MSFATIHTDCFTELADRADCSLHAVCTDPPYGLIEFTPEQVAKRRAGKGGAWRIPPTFAVEDKVHVDDLHATMLHLTR